MEHTGRAAIVTGGSRGLGRAMACAIGAMGCPVVVNYLASADAAAAVVAEITAAGGRALAVQADVSDPAQATALATRSREAFGPTGMLVNNAGIGPRRALLDATDADFDAVLAANLRSAFLMTQAVLPDLLAQRWGRLVFLSSLAARTGGVISAAYAASKAGTEGLMHWYATQGLAHGITANAVAPAFIETDMLAGAPLPPPAQMPLGRMGRPEEVAALVETIVRSGFLTGQTIHLNAGRYMT